MTHKICSNLRLSATLCFAIVAVANTSHLLMEIAYPSCKLSAKFHFTFRFPFSVPRVAFSPSCGSVRSLAWQPNRFVIDAPNKQPRFAFPPLFLLIVVESWRQYLRREFLLRVDHERLPRQFHGKRGSIAGYVEMLSGFVGRIYTTNFVVHIGHMAGSLSTKLTRKYNRKLKKIKITIRLQSTATVSYLVTHFPQVAFPLWVLSRMIRLRIVVHLREIF